MSSAKGGFSTARWRFWVVFLTMSLCAYGIIKTYHVMVAAQPDHSINLGVEYFVDAGAVENINDVLLLPDDEWQQQQGIELSLRFDKYDYWLRFRLDHLNLYESWLLELGLPLLDSVDVWFFSDRQLLSEYHTGDDLPFRMRAIAHERFIFPIPAARNDGLMVYLHVSSIVPNQLPISVWSEKNYLVFNGEHSIAMGLFFGFMLAMALSNFFYFISSRSVSFLLYCGYAVSVALLLFSLHGMAFKYLWPNNIWLQTHGVGLFTNSTLFFSILFFRQILALWEQYPKVDTSLLGIAGFFLFVIGCSFFVKDDFSRVLYLWLVQLIVLYVFAIGIWLWRSGLRVSKVYVVAWMALMVTVMISSFDALSLGIIEINSAYVLMVGATLETVLLALLLAQDYSERGRALTQAQEAKIALQRQTNEALENKVQERTLELQMALRELSETNRQLEEKNNLDALTGIYNRQFFDKKYQSELRRSHREKYPLAIAMVDIDHFKRVNDTYGHLVGDECIKFVASAILPFLRRPGDAVCRFGGEEFAIVMPHTDTDGAFEVLERIRKNIANNPVYCEQLQVPLTISAGVASTVFATDTTGNSLLDNADTALYQAKREGRNQTQCYQATQALAQE